MSDFVHTHLHSQYSLLDGAIRIKDLVKTTADMGMSAVAVTDHGNMYGAIDFYTSARKAGIKPILGVEAYVTTGDHRAKERGSYHLVLLAKDLTGYQNLIYLQSMAHMHGFYYNPRVDHELLRNHSEGLIASTACLGGEVPKLLLNGNMDEARDRALMYEGIFGKGNFFLEVQSNGIADQERVNALLAQLGEDTGIPLVGTNDSHYLRAEDARAHEHLLCIQTGKTIHDESRMQYGTDQLYLKSPEEMHEGLSMFPGALENTARIAEMCNVELKLKDYKLPKYPVPDGETTDSAFEREVRKGYAERLAELRGLGQEINQDIYDARLDMELGVIKQTGFPGYFLVVSDFIIWAKEQNIPVGPGRGSGAGSLVAYSMKITDIDPIRYDLLFERFLNTERVSMPDFDIDFCQNRREEVIQYVSDKYGKNNVSQIITFGTLKARAVIRDVGRVMDLPYGDVDRIAKLVPNQLGITLPEAITLEPQLREMITKGGVHKDLLEISQSLEGLNRHAGIHAAGVVIADRPLWEYVPLARGKDDAVVTQYAKDEVELAGMVKFDFLGLKTLTVLDVAIQWIDRRSPEGTAPFDLRAIPLDDAAVYKLISRADTLGVFQLESSGFRELLKRIRPDHFEDIIASVALYRPGPLEGGMVDDYIARKHGEKVVRYPHPLVEDVLKETYGVIVYQEQVMRIAAVLAGYNLGEADELRKGMGKKIQALMDKHDTKFNTQAVERGVDKRVARDIFDTMAKFAKYGFNKSHSAAYGLITYQTAYLKAHYPVEFLTAMLTLDKDNTEKVIEYIAEARRMGIVVKPPDANQSLEAFTIDGESSIRFGLGAVKGVGSGAVEAVVEARESGPFESLLDFLDRADLRRVNRKVVEALISAGAFDSLGIKRSILFTNVDRAMARAQQMAADRASGQMSLLGGLLGGPGQSDDGSDFDYVGENSWSTREMLSREMEAVGFYLSDHPLNRYSSQMANLGLNTIAELMEKDSRQDVEMAVVVSSLVEKMSKKTQRKFGSMILEDLTGRIEAVLFSDAYEKSSAIAATSDPVLIRGKLQVDGDDPENLNRKITVREMLSFEKIGTARTRRVRLRLPSTRLPPKRMEALKTLLSENNGQTTFSFVVKHQGQNVEIHVDPIWYVKPSETLYEELEMLFGRENVSFS
jgi:DNA polymerase III subunit alpha